MTYRGYSIEQEQNGSFSAYNIVNSMYDVYCGFKTVEDAKAAIDDKREHQKSKAYWY